MADDLRQVIRSILVEELAKHGMRKPAGPGPGVRVEEVEIRSDDDLMRFARRLLTLAGNATAAAEIDSGRHVFRLKHGRTGERAVPPASGRSAHGRTMTFDRGLITEKQVRNFPDNVAVVKVGPGALLTPLAGDAIRRAGIKLEKVKT